MKRMKLSILIIVMVVFASCATAKVTLSNIPSEYFGMDISVSLGVGDGRSNGTIGKVQNSVKYAEFLYPKKDYPFNSDNNLADVYVDINGTEHTFQSVRFVNGEARINWNERVITGNNPQATTATATARETLPSVSTRNVSSSGQSSEDDFDIKQNTRGTITITGYHGTATNVVIPEKIEGVPVTEIAESVFYYHWRNLSGNIAITSVIIPDSVTTIGREAFLGSHLTSVIIPNSVTSIGASAFAGEYHTGEGKFIGRLTSVTISNNITSIADGAFSGNQLTTVTIPDKVTAIGNNAFSDNKLTSVTIPNRVTTIGNNAFINNKLISVTIGNGVTTIGFGAFANNQITSVIIPNSVTTFVGNTRVDQDGAFFNNRLTSITIPNSVTSIGQGTFANNQLTSVAVSNSATAFMGSGTESAFANNPITSITLPANANLKGNADVFSNSFEAFYESQGKKAGTYIWSGRIWRVE